MKEISLNVLDVVGNSVKAKAKRIDIMITESVARDVLELSIIDDGCGMAPEFLARVTDPFTTTRTTRKVGLGLPLCREREHRYTLLFSFPILTVCRWAIWRKRW